MKDSIVGGKLMFGKKLGFGCPTPGRKIRSGGKGRGLARGRGFGPIGGMGRGRGSRFSNIGF